MGGPGSGRRPGGARKGKGMSKSSTKPKRKVKSTFILGKQKPISGSSIKFNKNGKLSFDLNG